MTIKHIRFPSIEQFRNVVHNVNHQADYVGMDADGNAILDPTRPRPTLKFVGTVKLHGTNSSMCLDSTGNFWVQSRENIITPQKDNAGFAMFVEQHKEAFRKLCDDFSSNCGRTVVVWGEFCAGNIQKGVALSQLPKMFVIFNVALVDDEGHKEWYTKEQISFVLSQPNQLPDNVHFIYDVPHYEIEIDFNKPHEYQNQLSEMTIAVEEECPVGKHFGVSGIGEGIVWSCVTPGYLDGGYRYKVKGEKHAAKSRVKTLKTVDVDKVNAIAALAEQITPIWRLEQMVEQTFDTLNGGRLDIKQMSNYIKAVMDDIVKEDMDLIVESGFTMKEVQGSISKIARDYLIVQLNDLTK